MKRKKHWNQALSEQPSVLPSVLWSTTFLVLLSFNESVQNFEKELIVEALKRTNGNASKAAILLKITNRILNYKINQLQINPKIYKIKK